MLLATTTSDFSRYTREINQVISYLSQTPFKYVDLGFSEPFFEANNELLLDNWKQKANQIKSLAESKGLEFVQAHAPMGRPIVKDENYDNFMFLTIRSIEIAAELGIKNIVVHSGYDYYLSKEECFIKNKEFYTVLLNTAEKYGINILTENFNKMCVKDLYWIDSAKDERELIEFIDHPLFHACWDTGHGNMQETTQYEALTTLDEHVYALHIHDNHGDDDDHVAPFFGNMDIDSLMRGLKKINYKGYFTFESCNMMLAGDLRKSEIADDKLSKPPIDLKILGETFLYHIGTHILSEYQY